MPVPHKKKKLLALPANTQGKDYVVGDLHGCLEELLVALKELEFNEATDRLFSVGDLIDRGPFSKECAELIYKPWFYAVKGNHEQMMIDALIKGRTDMAATWIWNGGQWMYDHDRGELVSLARDLDFLPLVITVGEGTDRFNIVHAELKHTEIINQHPQRVPVNDMMLAHWPFDSNEEADMIWGRTIVSNGREKIEQVPPHELWHDMDKLSLTFVGHTPVRFPVQCQKQMYIDNGAVYHHTNSNKSEGNMLVLACPSTKTVHAYSMVWKKINNYTFDEIQKMG